MSRSDHAESSRSASEPAENRSPKAELRTIARERRRSWSSTDRVRWSAAAGVRLADLLPPRGPIATYAAMGDELDLGGLNETLAAAGRLCLPRVEGRALVMVPTGPATPLVRSRFGVPEPVGEPIDPGGLAAVVVPGLAFDSVGHRIGYGAGFYDRFLPTVRPTCVVVGVCFAGQVVDAVPSEPHDIPLAAVVTETGVIEVGRRPSEPPAR